MGVLFYWIFNMSITATIMGVFVLILRRIRKIPRRFIQILWWAPFIRMIVPVSINTPYSLLTLVDKYSRKIFLRLNTNAVSLSTINYIKALDSYYPVQFRQESFRIIFDISGMIWVSVALLLHAALLIVYRQTMQELKYARKGRENNCYFSDKIKGPAVYGIRKPKICLPLVYEKENNPYILEHERMHIARRDNLKRLLAVIIVCFHWFNPLAWKFLKLYLDDIEFSCDEAVISRYSENQKKEYALALVGKAKEKTFLVSAFENSNLRLRIENVLLYKKMSRFATICLAVFMLTVLYIMLTN